MPRAAAPEIDLDHDYSVGDQHLPRKRLLIREWGEEGGQDRITTRHHKTARWNVYSAVSGGSSFLEL